MIRDAYKFSESYTPSKLPHREKEVELIVNSLASSVGVMEGLVLIRGEPGIGKTSVAKLSSKRLESRMPGNLRVVHVNCRTYRTPTSVIQRIASSIMPGIPDRGLSYQEMILMLEKALSKENKDLLVILDEIDYLRDGDSLVYTLLRLHEGEAPKSPTLIAIARWDPPYMMDDSIRSFMVTRMSLEKYMPEQLETIVRYRAEVGLVDGSYDDEIVKKVVELSEHTGNARVSLKILYLAARLSEEVGLSKITPDMVSEAASRIGVIGITDDYLTSLDLHDKILLLSAAKLLSSSDRSWIKMGDLLEEYKLLCEEIGVMPYKYTAVWKRVRNLRRIGILETKKSGEGMKGQTTLISLGSIPADKLSKKLKEILREELSPLPLF
ncbi:MAG: hypothetical protein DRN78_03680 [Thermoproteota archaeon]|nr:MAG: hypothetical protein DRN78_03680 [Candidatus Korarchaeota archaeon]